VKNSEQLAGLRMKGTNMSAEKCRRLNSSIWRRSRSNFV